MSSEAGYLRHFVACNRHDLGHFAPFFIDNRRLGWTKKDTAAFLARETTLFEPYNSGLVLAKRFTDFSSRSDALSQAIAVLTKHFGKDLRNEMYAVGEKWGDAPLAQLDRVGVPWFGVPAYGTHVNGYVRKKDGLYLWIGERAANRIIDPSKLDNIIGGGLPIGLTLEQNLCKEAKEEASIDASLALTAKRIRTISYRLELPDGLRADTLFIYDIELPEGFMPQNTDGEVAAFHLLPLAEVARIIRDTDIFKFNCPLVIVDFLMRHEFFAPQDAEGDALKTWLMKAI